MACKFSEDCRLRIIGGYFRLGSPTAARREFNNWRITQPDYADIPLCTNNNVNRLLRQLSIVNCQLSIVNCLEVLAEMDQHRESV